MAAAIKQFRKELESRALEIQSLMKMTKMGLESDEKRLDKAREDIHSLKEKEVNLFVYLD